MNQFRVLRSLLVAIGAVCALGLLVSLAFRVYGAHRLAEVSKRYEREVGPLDVNVFTRKKVAVEQNAVTWQRPGVLAAVYFPNDATLLGSLSSKSFPTWTTYEAAGLETILERNRPAIELLERSRGLTASNWDIPYGQGAAAKIPNLLAAITTAKMLNARGRLCLGKGDRATALASAETLGALAHSHEEEPALIVLLIGLAIEKLQLALVNDIVAAPLTTPAELDRLKASLCDADLKRAVRTSIRAAAAANVHDFQAEPILFTIGAPAPPLLAGVLADMVAAATLEANLAADKQAGEPVHAPLYEADAEHGELGWWARLPVVIGGNLGSASARATMTASARDFGRLAIALRRHALTTGRYPTLLPEVEGVPMIDPLTGGPRLYEANAGGSVELRSSTSEAIFRSIAPGSQLPYESLFRWSLPAPH